MTDLQPCIGVLTFEPRDWCRRPDTAEMPPCTGALIWSRSDWCPITDVANLVANLGILVAGGRANQIDTDTIIWRSTSADPGTSNA